MKQPTVSTFDSKCESLRRALLKPRRYKYRDLKRITNGSNSVVDQALNKLREEGMKILFSKLDRVYYLSTIPTPYSDYFDLSRLPAKGQIGVVSDTHLCSNADRVDLIEKAYDNFQQCGIKTVFHAGDIMDGWHVYKGHSQFIKTAGGHNQAVYCIKKYPGRPGITTYFIGGNHDGRSYEDTGVDQCSLVVNGFDHEGKHYEPRKDMVYLGQYSRFILLPQNVTVQLLHPRGSNPYAKSYAQQKRAREFKTETRPNLQISGHMHQFNFLREDTTFMLAMPGFQDETEFFIRQGYRRDIGYIIFDYEIDKGRFSRVKIEYVELT